MAGRVAVGAGEPDVATRFPVPVAGRLWAPTYAGLFASLALLLAASLLAGSAYVAGQFAPNSAVILTSAAWQDALATVLTGLVGRRE